VAGAASALGAAAEGAMKAERLAGAVSGIAGAGAAALASAPSAPSAPQGLTNTIGSLSQAERHPPGSYVGEAWGRGGDEFYARQAEKQSQRGGGQGQGKAQDQLSSFDTIILTGIAALIGGGAFLTAGRHYAWTTGPSDSPPLARRV